MNRIIALALAIVFGVAQAMTTPHPSSAASTAASTALTTATPPHMDMDDDEAAPPVHIHHAHATSKKPIKKQNNKKIAPVYRPKPYSLLLTN